MRERDQEKGIAEDLLDTRLPRPKGDEAAREIFVLFMVALRCLDPTQPRDPPNNAVCNTETLFNGGNTVF